MAKSKDIKSSKSAKHEKKNNLHYNLTRKISIFDEDFSILSYKGKKRIRTTFLPATWGHVFIYSLIYAVAIFAIKVVYFELWGKPQIFTMDYQEDIRTEGIP
jgi:hypothetical protein